jgi:pyrroloquinoline quinone (PQQ) biosynthesis protein C
MTQPMKTTILTIKERVRALDNPYFSSLRDGTMSREDFVETQVQFLFAVVFFSRPMMVLAARMPRNEMRVGLLENVADEHGDGNLTTSHERTFLDLLRRLGVDTASIEDRPLWPEVRAFNTTLTGLSLMDDPRTGLAALGMIEDLFSAISGELGASIVRRGWLAEDEIVHYAVHEELDQEHAEDFYKPLYAAFAADPVAAYQIEQGLELGAYIFLRMYRDLYEARGRRAVRVVGGAHSVADGWRLPD